MLGWVAAACCGWWRCCLFTQAGSSRAAASLRTGGSALGAQHGPGLCFVVGSGLLLPEAPCQCILPVTVPSSVKQQSLGHIRGGCFGLDRDAQAREGRDFPGGRRASMDDLQPQSGSGHCRVSSTQPPARVSSTAVGKSQALQRAQCGGRRVVPWGDGSWPRRFCFRDCLGVSWSPAVRHT